MEKRLITLCVIAIVMTFAGCGVGTYLTPYTPTTPPPATTSIISTTKPPIPSTTQPIATFPVTNSSLNIVSITSPIRRGADATLKVITKPNTKCTITVYYHSGPGTAAGLTSKTSDSDGNVSWTWQVGTNITPGSWKIVITAAISDPLANEAANNAIARGGDPNAGWIQQLTTWSQSVYFTVI